MCLHWVFIIAVSILEGTKKCSSHDVIKPLLTLAGDGWVNDIALDVCWNKAGDVGAQGAGVAISALSYMT